MPKIKFFFSLIIYGTNLLAMRLRVIASLLFRDSQFPLGSGNASIYKCTFSGNKKFAVVLIASKQVYVYTINLEKMCHDPKIFYWSLISFNQNFIPQSMHYYQSGCLIGVHLIRCHSFHRLFTFTQQVWLSLNIIVYL